MSSTLPFQTSESKTSTKDLCRASSTNNEISLNSDTAVFNDGKNNQTLIDDESSGLGAESNVLKNSFNKNGARNEVTELVGNDSFSLNETNLMNDTSHTSPEDSIGFSPADTAEKKLQYSLDELIEQQSRGVPSIQSSHKKKINKHLDRKDKYSPFIDTINSFRLQKNNANDYRKQYPRNVRVALQKMRSSPYNIFPPASAPHLLLSRTDKYSYPPVLPDTQMVYRQIIPNGYVDNTLAGKFFFASTAAGSLYPSWQFAPVAPNGSIEDIALSEIDIVVPDSLLEEHTTNNNNFALIVKFKGTEVLKVRKPQGELILNSGGWRTISTRVVLNCALKPLALWIEPVSSETSGSTGSTSLQMSDHDTFSQWNITDGKSYLATFHDDMVIGQVGLKSLSSLLARASVIAQHLRQAKHSATMRRTQFRFPSRGP